VAELKFRVLPKRSATGTAGWHWRTHPECPRMLWITH